MGQSQAAVADKTPAVAVEIPSVAGAPFGGGFYVGHFFDGTKPYVLIAAPAAGGDFEPLPWKKALDKAAKLKLGGFSDWSLPNRTEALALFERLRDPLSKTDDCFEDDVYWTSTQYASDSYAAWGQYFYDGSQGYWYEGYNGYRARAVRRHFIDSALHQFGG